MQEARHVWITMVSFASRDMRRINVLPTPVNILSIFHPPCSEQIGLTPTLQPYSPPPGRHAVNFHTQCCDQSHLHVCSACSEQLEFLPQKPRAVPSRQRVCIRLRRQMRDQIGWDLRKPAGLDQKEVNRAKQGVPEDVVKMGHLVA